MSVLSRSQFFVLSAFALSVMALTLVGAGCTYTQTDEVEDSDTVVEDVVDGDDDDVMKKDDDDAQADDTVSVEEESGLDNVQSYSVQLDDVSGGEGRGLVLATLTDGTEYALLGNINDVPDPEGTDFYEGWIVRKEPSSVVSTGRLEKGEDGNWVDKYTASEDMTDHDFYVLTLEPDDGDPAPATHILEGTLTKN